MANDIILGTVPLGMPWATIDPFLFCMHHSDDYPAGNGQMAPAASLDGRNIGSDFSSKDGWSMYHGDTVPGFPAHPHRGFETVTVVRRGVIDHSDSLGATARFGDGDCQWMTAGKGIVHCEMFPLRNTRQGNPAELFQIWLNLPRKDKMVDPYFTMLWDDTIPRFDLVDGEGRTGQVTVVAGRYAHLTGPPPPPNSWAADPENHVGIWTVKLSAHAQATLPAAPEGVMRTLYFFSGERLLVDGKPFERGHAIQVRADLPTPLQMGAAEGELLVLQGRPIGEPVARHGPFVMNTQRELQEAYTDYRSTRFGGWPWGSADPVHPATEDRFAVHADGRKERPATG